MNLKTLAEDDSWATLWDSSSKTPDRIRLRLSVVGKMPNPYKSFVEIIDDAVDYASIELTKNKNVVHSLGEDQLTLYLLTHLDGMGFDAAFERNVGGNCDISITGINDMLWLGEAKIYRSSGNLLGGLRQLVDRYSTGLINQDCGAVIIYVKNMNTKKIMSTWHKRLSITLKNGVVGAFNENKMTFTHTVEHAGSGRDLSVRHVPVVLFHSATEKLPNPNWSKKNTLSIGSNR